MSFDLGSLELSESKRNMIYFLRIINGFKSIDIYYRDTDSLFVESKHWGILKKTGLIGKKLSTR